MIFIVSLCVFMSVCICVCYSHSICRLLTINCMVGSKSCLVFSSDLFENDSEWYVRLKNVLIGEPVCVLCVCTCVANFFTTAKNQVMKSTMYV